MKVLVTGGAGFLGSYVADALSESGHDVVVFDQNESPYVRDDQKMVIGDLLDEGALGAAMKGCEGVYHFAAIADIEEASRHPLDTIKTNVLGTALALDLARRHKISRFVFASSIYVYSNQGSFYRSSKQACEQFIQDFKDRFDLPYTILRFGSLYGPRAGESNAVHRMLKQALTNGRIDYAGSGEEIREYIHAHDAAQSACDVLAPEYENAIIHLPGHERMTTGQMLEMIREMLGNKVEIHFNQGTRVGHYMQTPYSYTPKLGRKLIRSTYIDLGLGLLQCTQDIDRSLNDTHDT